MFGIIMIDVIRLRVAVLALLAGALASAIGDPVLRPALRAQQTAPPKPAAAPAHGAAPSQPTAAPDTVHHFSGVVGVAIDSLHGPKMPLKGATVLVTGTSRQGVTDTLGNFRIDSVPPGDYSLSLAHPSLDSIGLAIATQQISLPAGRYTVVRLSTPSPETAVRLLCPKEKLVMGPGAVIGRVLDADTDAPDSGTRVVAYWVQLDVSTALGVHRSAKVREARTDAGGLFRICGLPMTMQGQLRATRGGITTADVPVVPQDDPLTIVYLHLGTLDTAAVVASAAGPGAAPAGAAVAAGSTAAPAATGAGAGAPTAAAASGAGVASASKVGGVPVAAGLRTGHAVVSGLVTDSKGNPLPGADISVEGAAATTVTTDAGQFTLRGLPNGTQALEVRKLSFAPARVAVDLSNHTPRVVNVKLAPAPPTLATVVVEGKMDKGLRDVGFAQRKKAGLGHFVTADQIAQRGAIRLTDIFSQMPGIRVNYTTDPPTLAGSREAGNSGCISYVFDGIQTPMDDPGDFDTFMQPDEIAAVEVYTSSEAPPQYSQPGRSNCSVIMIWSKTRVGGNG